MYEAAGQINITRGGTATCLGVSLAELLDLIEQSDLHQSMNSEPTVFRASSQKQIKLKRSASKQSDQSNYILHLTYKVIKKHIFKISIPVKSVTKLNHKHTPDTKCVSGKEIDIESLPYFTQFVIN